MELEKIRELLAELLSADIEKISENTRLVKDLGMDSLDMFQLIAEIEDVFGIELNTDEIAKIKTVGDAAAYAKTKF